MLIHEYLQKVNQSLRDYDAETLSTLLSFKNDHIKNPNLFIESPEDICQRFINFTPYDELWAAHIKALWAYSNEDWKFVFACQLSSIQSFVKSLQAVKDENWSLPLMYTLILDLRYFANKIQNCSGGMNKTDAFEKAADSIMACFRVCGSDGRTSLEVSKKWGMLFLVNQLFKIYFRIGKLHLCKPLIRAIESSSIKEDFNLAQKVTYKYFVGRKAMFDSDFATAGEYLSYAFENCHKNCRSNLRSILVCLIPVKMLLGHLPPKSLLKDHNLSQFGQVAEAVRNGNVCMFNQALVDNESFFIKTGTYLILEKLRAITFRTLFKKVKQILNRHQLPLQAFVDVLQAQGVKFNISKKSF